MGEDEEICGLLFTKLLQLSYPLRDLLSGPIKSEM